MTKIKCQVWPTWHVGLTRSVLSRARYQVWPTSVTKIKCDETSVTKIKCDQQVWPTSVTPPTSPSHADPNPAVHAAAQHSSHAASDIASHAAGHAAAYTSSHTASVRVRLHFGSFWVITKFCHFTIHLPVGKVSRKSDIFINIGDGNFKFVLWMYLSQTSCFVMFWVI